MDAAADALIVVDMQSAFVFGPGAVPSAKALVTAAERLLDAARAAGALVVQLQNDGPPGAPDEVGTDGWTLLFLPAVGEFVLRKTHDDAFVDTRLESVLLDYGVTTVAICGVQSEMCVAATARGAMLRGMSVVLPQDAHATYPVPADDAGGIAVPASHVSRVAEWSLGEGISAPSSSSDVRFRPPPH